MSAVLELARSLIACESVNPPGDEARVADILEPRLLDAGLDVERHSLEVGRDSLIARLGPANSGLPSLCFTGHLDTVPLGEAAWDHDPFAGVVDGDRLYGRGASDMKGGVAAIVSAIERVAALGPPKAGLEVVLCAGEETGCTGAKSLVDALGTVGAVMVAEPTSNRPLVAHKGALWLEATARGRTAHGSTPHLGRNAIYQIARAVGMLEHWSFGEVSHPLLGVPTLNVGTIRGGLNINSVPDSAAIGIDIRTIPQLSHQSIIDSLQKALAADIELECLCDLPAVASDPHLEWVGSVCEVVGELAGDTMQPGAAQYFTDASILTPAYGTPPTVILGPGDPDQAHQTNESCSHAGLVLAEEAYFQIARRWCGL
jgi:succinyl-diaminopimelate desuccinylase